MGYILDPVDYVFGAILGRPTCSMYKVYKNIKLRLH